MTGVTWNVRWLDEFYWVTINISKLKICLIDSTLHLLICAKVKKQNSGSQKPPTVYTNLFDVITST